MLILRGPVQLRNRHSNPPRSLSSLQAADTARAADIRRAFSDVGGRVVLGTPKSHQSRSVPIPRFIAAEIAVAVTDRRANDLMFTVPGGSVMRLSNGRRAVFLPARNRAGLSTRFRNHDLRHTAASLMIQAGYPPKMLQEILGHASITTTPGPVRAPVPRRDGPLRRPSRQHGLRC
jgi:integrase